MAYKLSDKKEQDNEQELQNAPWYAEGRNKYETASGDGGFLDSFNALKQQIDFVYDQYKHQKSGLVRRKNELADNLRQKIIRVALLAGVPVMCALLLAVLTFLGLRSGFFSIIYLVVMIATPALIFVCDIGLLPGAVRELANAVWQSRVLNSKEDKSEYRKSHSIISFDDEERFLKEKLGEIEAFYREVEEKGLDRKDGSLQVYDTDVMTPEQMEIIERMRTMSLAKDYSTSVLETRREAGAFWIIVGFAILVALFIFVCIFFA